MKIFQKIVLVALFSAALFVNAQASVSAQQNISCNNANYKNQTYIDVMAKPNETVKTYFDYGGPGKVVVTSGGSVIATVTKNNPGAGAVWDTRPAASTAKTYRYQLYMCNANYTSCTPFQRWMPSNVAPHQYKCGTGCYNGQIYYAVVSKQAMYDAAVADGSTPYNLNDSGYTLFKSSERTVNRDTSITCWADSPGTDAPDNDFNDGSAMWTVKTILPPTTIPPTTIPPTTIPPTTVPPTTVPPTTIPPTTVPPTTLPPTTTPPTRTPSVTHTPGDTGFAEDSLIYLGGVLYGIGVISFMGARILATKKLNKR